MVLLFGVFIRQQEKRNNMSQELIISAQSSNMDFVLYFLFMMLFSIFFYFLKNTQKVKKAFLYLYLIFCFCFLFVQIN
ncbi:hypothetical protein EAE91_06170 [Photorhabdus noenieputensis]|nr:hypothetical protein [Photorhabdus noenieputensis]